MHKSQSLSQLIKLACLLTLLIMGLGSGFALYKNWQVRLASSQVQLIRGSEMVNMLLERGLTDSQKTLRATKYELEKALQKGDVSPQQAYVILMYSLYSLSNRNTTVSQGSLFWINAEGNMVARSGAYEALTNDFSDRYYFQDLRDNPAKRETIGPLLVARTSGEQVFHMAVTVYDKQGEFAGVLAQQLLVKDIASELEKYITPSDFKQILTHYNGSPASFVYPLPAVNTDQVTFISDQRIRKLNQLKYAKGTAIWNEPNGMFMNEVLVGFARSSNFGLITFSTLSISQMVTGFMNENMELFVYVLIGTLIILLIFYQVHTMSIALLSAQDSALHDPLTLLHNRRALDENLPLLLRESMRSQQPVSVLFIDIDFFRRFNENHGHETGDVALVAVAQSLAACCRRPLDLMCRWGGEEFVAVLPQTNAFAAEKIALDMLSAVRSIHLNLPVQADAHITVSVGCVTTTVSKLNQTDDLIDMADKAMQTAKSRGRNQLAVFHNGKPLPIADKANLLATL